MCCFSGPVEYVANTKIFARKSGVNTQFLVYQMEMRTQNNVAMILPLPVANNSPANAVRFISLKNYPSFFGDMKNGFPKEMTMSLGAGGFGGGSGVPPPLPVIPVGNFVASYVPSIADFTRLDKQFTLPKDVWDGVPNYADYGFAVFQLNVAQNKNATVHPMALEFVTRLSQSLFFPTVHIHDGKVHPTEHFDHWLYLQAGAVEGAAWQKADKSVKTANRFIQTDGTRGIVLPDQSIYRLPLRGNLTNQDTFCRVGNFGA
jgi:hypothetical protein